MTSCICHLLHFISFSLVSGTGPKGKYIQWCRKGRWWIRNQSSEILHSTIFFHLRLLIYAAFRSGSVSIATEDVLWNEMVSSQKTAGSRLNRWFFAVFGGKVWERCQLTTTDYRPAADVVISVYRKLLPIILEWPSQLPTRRFLEIG